MKIGDPPNIVTKIGKINKNGHPQKATHFI